MALVDANYKFTAVDTGSYGKKNIYILIELSNLLLFRSRLKNNDIKEFPLKTYLMRPYLGSESIEDIRKKKI